MPTAARRWHGPAPPASSRRVWGLGRPLGCVIPLLMQLNTSRAEERSDERGSPIVPKIDGDYRGPSLRSGSVLWSAFIRENPRRDALRRGARECLRCCAGCFRLFGQLAEARRILQGDVGKHFAVELDAGLLQSVDEVAVGKAVQAGGGADADDPDRAVLALLLFASEVGELHATLHRFLRSLVEF